MHIASQTKINIDLQTQHTLNGKINNQIKKKIKKIIVCHIVIGYIFILQLILKTGPTFGTVLYRVRLTNDLIKHIYIY